VLKVGEKVVQANPEIGLHPAFTTIGAPNPEVFHRREGKVCQVVISEGLVRQCKTEGQLAAVLCQELGKMVSEETALSKTSAGSSDRSPPYVPVGNDQGGSFGAADGTRYAELAKLNRDRPQPKATPVTPPAPDVLARTYLQKAGYAVADLDDARPL